MSEIHEKLRKLLALCRQGVGGEKYSAQARLEVLMRKHGIALAEIDDDAKTLRWIKVPKEDYGKRLLMQVVVAVVGTTEHWINRHRRSQVGVEMTAAQFVEIELKYAAYAPALKKELDIAYRAFVQTNRIFPSPDADDDAEVPELSAEELEELKRICMAMHGMTPLEIRKELPMTKAVGR